MDIVLVQAGYSKCCNYVIVLLFKIEFAGEHGFIDPSCTERACSWNNCSNKDIQPKRVGDMVIVELSVRSNANPKFTINNNTKRSFDPRPLALWHKGVLLKSISNVSFLK